MDCLSHHAIVFQTYIFKSTIDEVRGGSRAVVEWRAIVGWRSHLRCR